MALIDAADVSAVVGQDIATDPYLNDYINGAQAQADRYCKQPLEAPADPIVISFDRTWDRKSSYWVAYRFPVAELVAVTRDGEDVLADVRLNEAATVLRLTNGAGYDRNWSTLIDGNVVEFRHGFGAPNPAPYNVAPDDLKRAIAETAADMWRAGQAQVQLGPVPVSAVALAGSDSVTYQDIDTTAVMETHRLTQAVRDTLNEYRRWIF